MEMNFNLMQSNHNAKNNRKKNVGLSLLRLFLGVFLYFCWFMEAIGHKLLTTWFGYVWPLQGC